MARSRKTMNKKIILNLCLIGALTAVAVGGTIAYFSDTETSVGNKFVAGKLNLKIDNTCHYNGKECMMVEPGYYVWQGTDEQCFCSWELKDLAGELFFNLLDVKPGDNGEDTVSLHIINNDAWVCAQVANLTSDDNGCELPESLMDATCGAGGGELKENLFFTIWEDTNCDNILDAGEQVLVDNQPAEEGVWPIADSNTGAGPLEGGQTYCLGVKWNVPIETSNIIQSDSLIGDVMFTAVQARHMESFKCSDLVGGEECSIPEDCSQYYIAPVCDSQSTCQGHRQDATCINGYCGFILVDDDSACGPSVLANDCGPSPDLFCNGNLNQEAPQCEFLCVSNEDCDDGLYCNGEEICGAGNICQGGTPPVGTDGFACTLDVCDEDLDAFVFTPNDELCNDGYFCTGNETCNPGNPLRDLFGCVAGTPPCAENVGDNDSDCSESCDETNDTCTANDPAGSFCNDGLYCNGTETCSAGVCANSSGDPCPGPDGDGDCSESCNETNDDCSSIDPDGCLCPGGLCISGVCTAY